MNFNVESCEFRWMTSCWSSSSLPWNSMRIASMYLSHTSGCVPCQFKAVASSFPIKRFASVGATSVPMAARLNDLPANWKVFSVRMSLNVVMTAWWICGNCLL